MKTTFLKGFVLASLSILLGFVASAQERPVKKEAVERNVAHYPSIAEKQKKVEVNKTRKQRPTNIQALPPEKNVGPRKQAMQNK